MRTQAWIIVERLVETDGDTDTVYDVLHGRKSAATGLNTQQAARRIVVAHRVPGERVWLQEASDGYMTELTRTFPAPAVPHAPKEAPTAIDPNRPARSRYLARYGLSRRLGKWV